MRLDYVSLSTIPVRCSSGEKDCTAFLFLRSVQINSLHRAGNFPWVVYLLPDNMRLLNTCAQQALVICLRIVALCCKHSIYTCALQMACLYLVINIFHLELSASATEMRSDHLSMKDKENKSYEALSCIQNKWHNPVYEPVR